MRKRRQYHPVLTNRELAERKAQRRQEQQDTMSPQEAAHRMRKAINEALDASGTVSEADMIRANVPAAAIKYRFGQILQDVLERRRQRGAAADPLPVVAINWDRSMQ